MIRTDMDQTIYKRSSIARGICLVALTAGWLPVGHRCQVFAGNVYDNLEILAINNIWGAEGEMTAQQFMLGLNDSLSSVTIELMREGTPSGRVDVEIWDDNGSGSPGNAIGLLGSIDDVSSFPQRPTQLTFDTQIEGLTPNEPHYVVMSYLEATGNDDDSLSWMVTRDNSGTNGAQNVQVLFPEVTPNWVPILDTPGAPPWDSLFFKMSVTAFGAASVDVPGDFNDDGFLDRRDIDLLSLAIRGMSNDLSFDITQDGKVDLDDQFQWVVGDTFGNTYIGDANLDGQFDSGDFIAVFVVGEYEDNIPQNSTWTDGDWNADGEFDSGDFVTAFMDGGYEQGPRRALAAVPEPSGITIIVLGFLIVSRRVRRK